MENKGSVLIAYLSQIILIILLLQVTGWLKGLSLIIIVITDILILSAIAREKQWHLEAWYAFFIFAIMLSFLVAYIKPLVNDTLPTLSVATILLLIIGFFVTTLGREKPRGEHQVEITDYELEAKVEVIKYRKSEDKSSEVRTKSKQPEKKKPEQKKVTNIVSKKGSTKYHISTCGYLKKAKKKDLRNFNSKKQAEAMGLTKCQNCLS